ncbi:MAG: cyclic nucleotide-binding domain-containing protein [Hyphomicrobiaceae bacterium]|nr:cyclic nucleotide-binding domain-containing protein [Hyphomicrobiaceae bacterium]
MKTHGMEDLLVDHPVFRDFDKDTLDLLSGCARNEHYRPGQMIYSEGEVADKFYILREGDVAIEVSAPGRAPLITETLHAGDLFGWAWLVAPYQHMSDARAISEVRAVSLDATCLRGKCETNPVLGYQMFQHWMPHMAARMRTMRMQLLDVYGLARA